MKALIKKYPEKGIWMEDVPNPKCGDNEIKIKIYYKYFCFILNSNMILLFINILCRSTVDRQPAAA